MVFDASSGISRIPGLLEHREVDNLWHEGAKNEWITRAIAEPMQKLSARSVVRRVFLRFRSAEASLGQLHRPQTGFAMLANRDNGLPHGCRICTIRLRAVPACDHEMCPCTSKL